jgi:hypothetical protein
MPEQSSDYRVAVFGAGGVGKSSIIHRFIDGSFNDNYVPTIEDTYRKVCDACMCAHTRARSGDQLRRVKNDVECVHATYYRRRWFTSVPGYDATGNQQGTRIRARLFGVVETVTGGAWSYH